MSRDIGYQRVNETGPVWIPVSNPATARRGITRAARLQPTRVPRACVGWVDTISIFHPGRTSYT